jgi:hypothetical protein
VILRSPAIAALLITSVAAPLAAQNIRGAVRDSASQQPIAGAVVMLLDSAGALLGRNITNERGQYSVAYVRVARVMRVVRIGFLPRELRVRDSETPDQSIDVVMVPFSTALSPVRIADRSGCPQRGDRAKTIALWEQARAGLLNTVVARETNSMWVHRLAFQRSLEGHSDRITRFVVTGDSTANSTRTFNAVRSARDFALSGFSVDSGGTRFMFGPDAEVLLDDAFAMAYCFRLVSPPKNRPRQVGLAFSPSDPRPGRMDIDGTLWIDTAARALRDIEFLYIGTPPRWGEFHPGGSVSFHEMNNGAVFIDRWYLRRVDATQTQVMEQRGEVFTTAITLFATENGGELAHAVWPDGQVWNASLGALRIQAVTPSGEPAPGAEVLLQDTPYRGTADSSGTILIRSLLPGPYSLRIRDARMAELDVSIPTKISFIAARDSTFRTTVKVSTTEEYVASLCKKDRQWEANDSTFILGRVVTPEGSPVEDAKVSFATKTKDGKWSWLKWQYRTGSDGVFESCGKLFNAGQKILIRVSRKGSADTDVERTVASKLTIAKVQIGPLQ